MNDGQIHRRSLLLASVLLGLGLVILSVLAVPSLSLRVISAVASFAGTCLTSGLFVLIYERWLRVEVTAIGDSSLSPTGKFCAEITSIINNRLRVAGEANKIGLVECVEECSRYDYSQALSESRKVTIILNDGRTWLSFHRDRLRKRFQDPSRETTVYLIHPDSEMVPVLARKGSINPDVLRSRIRESITLLAEVAPDNRRLEVLGHFLFNPYSLVLTEKVAVLTPYFTSRGGRTLPLYVFEDIGEDCYYQKLVKDVEGLRMDSKSLASSRSQNFVVVNGA